MNDRINDKPGTQALAEAIQEEYEADHVLVAIGMDDPEDGTTEFWLTSETSSGHFLRHIIEYLDIRAGALEALTEARDILNRLNL